MFVELVRLPEANFLRSRTEVVRLRTLFLLFMLFVSGGILEVYRQDRRLNTGDFFAASGAFFWRFVRLMLLSLVPFRLSVVCCIRWWTSLRIIVGDKAVADQVGYCIHGSRA